MQQVVASTIVASAEAIDPRRLPALLVHPGRKALSVARYTWVLHRRGVIRGAGAVLLLAGLLGVFEARDHIATGVGSAFGLLEARVAAAGLSINEINITGQALTSEADIFKALAIPPGMATFSYDADAARARLLELPAIRTATVRKVYPGHVDVSITEKVPVARWRVDGVTFLVDGDGEQIAVDGGWSELPLVVGDGAADDALVMIKAMDRFAKVKDGVAALSRIGDRRWDLIYYSGLRVQLPELGVQQALANLETYQERYQLLDRDVSLIDLRVPGVVTLRPGELAAKAIAEVAKAKHKKAGHHAADPAYETAAEKHGD